MSRIPPSVRSSFSSSCSFVAASCFGSAFSSPRGGLALQLLEVAKPRADGDEVGQRAAEPAAVHKKLSGAPGFTSDDFLRLLLGADEEDPATVRGQVRNEVVCRLDQRH